jgi:hypothetical protein
MHRKTGFDDKSLIVNEHWVRKKSWIFQKLMNGLIDPKRSGGYKHAES